MSPVRRAVRVFARWHLRAAERAPQEILMNVSPPRKASSAFLLLVVMSLVAVPGAFADGGAQHQTSLARPIPLGVSGGSAADRDGGFCCGGTLGGLVEDCSGNRYLLSNNHVLGRTNRALAGEDVIQPGLIDSSCRSNASAVVADFTEYVEISFDQDNRVDAAIARVRSGAVDTSGAQLDIGSVSANPIAPSNGMSVQKDGRTSGHTTGTVVANDVTVVVAYGKKCGAGGGPGAVMVDQFRISDGSFSTSGDSGSMIYTSGSNPRPVGLLFAGSSTSTIANKITNVLGADWNVGPLAMAGATPAGCSGGCASDADCSDGNACTTDTCNAGACLHAPLDCDDANACTDDSCVAGSCSHSSVDCNDGQVCTIDSCDAVGGCSNVSDPSCTDPCGDGVCDVSSENCSSCPDDCNGLTRGRKSERFCCGADAGCTDPRCTSGTQCSGTLGSASSGPPGLTVAAASAVKRRHSRELLALEDVVGHGIGESADGTPVIEVYLGRRNARTKARVPAAIEGIPVRVEVTGPFVTY
jgi:hypothetical protein